jgi:hypothetical protein
LLDSSSSSDPLVHSIFLGRELANSILRSVPSDNAFLMFLLKAVSSGSFYLGAEVSSLSGHAPLLSYVISLNLAEGTFWASKSSFWLRAVALRTWRGPWSNSELFLVFIGLKLTFKEKSFFGIPEPPLLVPSLLTTSSLIEASFRNSVPWVPSSSESLL